MSPPSSPSSHWSASPSPPRPKSLAHAEVLQEVLTDEMTRIDGMIEKVKREIAWLEKGIKHQMAAMRLNAPALEDISPPTDAEQRRDSTPQEFASPEEIAALMQSLTQLRAHITSGMGLESWKAESMRHPS